MLIKYLLQYLTSTIGATYSVEFWLGSFSKIILKVNMKLGLRRFKLRSILIGTNRI